MKKPAITFLRIVRTGVVNFTRSLSLAVAAMAVMGVTLTIVLFSVVASAAFNHTVAQLNSQLNISVYLNDSATTAQVNTLMSQLRGQPNVKKVTYFSKDQDLAEFKAQNANDESVLQGSVVAGSAIPARIRIDPVDVNKLQAIKNFLDKPENAALEDPGALPSYSGKQKEAIDKIARATDIIRKAGVAAVIIFIVVSVLIIFNTIQMAIFNRRDEIQIMRLLGAKTWFIRGPFVVESIMYGVISALASVLIIDVLFVGSASALQASSLGLLDIGYADVFFKSHFWEILLLQLMLGILIGAASSIVATRRYLKFKSK